MKLNLNAPFFQFINTAFDFVILNICFILTCLPVFTIGAALTALYTVTMAEAEDKGLPFTKTYFHTFTRCFIRSSLLFAGCICIGALLLFCLFFWLSFESLLALIPSVLSLAALIALVICLIYLFPLLARYECSSRQLLFNALFIGTSHLPATGLFAVIFAAAGFLFKIWYPARTFMLLMGCSFLAYCFKIFTILFVFSLDFCHFLNVPFFSKVL